MLGRGLKPPSSRDCTCQGGGGYCEDVRGGGPRCSHRVPPQHPHIPDHSPLRSRPELVRWSRWASMGGGGGQELPRAAVLQSSNSQKPPAPVSPFRRAEDLLKVLSSGLLGMQWEGGRTFMEEGGILSPHPHPCLSCQSPSCPSPQPRLGQVISHLGPQWPSGVMEHRKCPERRTGNKWLEHLRRGDPPSASLGVGGQAAP